MVEVLVRRRTLWVFSVFVDPVKKNLQLQTTTTREKWNVYYTLKRKPTGRGNGWVWVTKPVAKPVAKSQAFCFSCFFLDHPNMEKKSRHNAPE